MTTLAEQLAALMPSEETGAADGRAFGRLFVCSALGLGLYWAWLYLSCFSTVLFPETGPLARLGQTSQAISYVGYIAILLVSLGFVDRVAAIFRIRGGTVLISGGTCIATVALGLAVYAPPAASLPIVVVGSVATGVLSGSYLVAWGVLFARRFVYAPLQLSVALLTSALVCLAAMALPHPVVVAFVGILPAACGALYWQSRKMGKRAGFDKPLEVPGAAQEGGQEAPTRTQRIMTAFPWRPCFALSMMGLLYGLLFGLSFDHLSAGTEIAFVCALANAVVGIVITVYTAATKENFGFGSGYMVVLPLAVAGMLLFSFFSIDFIFYALLCVRAAYVVFDVMTWMQVPKIFAKTGNIRTFVVSRVALEAGFGVGLFVFKGALTERYEAFDATVLVVGVLLSVALMLAFTHSNVENAWGLLPVKQESGHRLRSASESIAEQYKLTNREREVMMLIMRGKNGPYIQEKLCISQSTYQTHARNLYRKLGVHSRQEVLELLDERLYTQKAREDAAAPGRKTAVR